MLRVVAVPPINRGAPCTMLSKVTGAQVSDTTGDDSSTTADNKIKMLTNIILSH